MFLGLAVVICDVYCRDLRSENVLHHLRLQLKDKRSNEDYPASYSLHGLSYMPPIYSNSLKSGYGSRGLFTSKRYALHNLSPVGHGQRYSSSPFSSLGFGTKYLPSGLSHGLLGLPSVSLDEHLTQGTYSTPSIAKIKMGNGNNRLLVPSKTGPVTFSFQGGSNTASASSSSAYSTPDYSPESNGLSAYSNSNSGSGINFPIIMASPHGTSQAFSSGFPLDYGSSTQFIPSSSSHPIMKSLVISSGPHGGSSSYNLPISGSSHGISALSSSSDSSAASLTFNFPTSPESHGNSALSSSSTPWNFSKAPSSEIYSSSDSHISLPKSSGSSTYHLPISSGSSSSSHYVPSHSDNNPGYSSDSSYSNPNLSYAASTSTYVGSDPIYSTLSSSHENSASSPTMTYAQIGNNYMPAYSSSSVSYKTPSDSSGIHSSVSPRYLEFTSQKLYDNVDSGSVKYDTISYSTPDGL